jgi:hypothetical protein
MLPFFKGRIRVSLARFYYAFLSAGRRRKLRFETASCPITAKPRQMRRDYGATAKVVLRCSFGATLRLRKTRPEGALQANELERLLQDRD